MEGKLPPVWVSKCTTPVKAKTSAPATAPSTSCAALTRRGLWSVPHTGSRERGGGLRQTLERDFERLTLGKGDAAGTAWATPLEQGHLALARDLAALNTSTGARWSRVARPQAAG